MRLLLLLAAALSLAVPSRAGFLIMCGGSDDPADFQSSKAGGRVAVAFRPGDAGGTSVRPAPGVCTWFDRGFRDGEPPALCLDPASAAAIRKGGVVVYNIGPRIPECFIAALACSQDPKQSYAAGQWDECLKRAAPERDAEAGVDKPDYSATERAHDFALVVGIEKYKSLPEAVYAERDARSVRAHLIAQGFPARNIIALSGQDATRAALQSYLQEWLPKNVAQDSRVFFYFSGHGAPDPVKGDAYLVPWDGDPKFLKSTAYPLRRAYDELAALKARQVVVALDSCFSGEGGRSVLVAGARPLVTKLEALQPKGVIVFTAAGADEITSVYEEGRHGLFTYFFLDGLNRARGRISAADLFAGLKPRVQSEALRQNREQTPGLSGPSPDQVFFAGPPRR